MAILQGGEHIIFRNLARFALDHDDGFFGGGENQVDIALILLLESGVGDEAAIHPADADTRDRG